MKEHEKTKTDGLLSMSLYNIAFTVTDLEKSIQWYCDSLNFNSLGKTSFDFRTGIAEIAMLEGNGIKLELIKFPNGKRIEELYAPAPLHLIPIGTKAIVFQVENLKIASEELEAKGVKFAWREQYLVGDKMLCTMIEDIDGNKINIFQTNTTI
jgi:catechol 2,3-dioxygenase-like lactoylglutathione lyase family enzyme